MFSGGVSRVVKYVTMGLALAFNVATYSTAMESMPVRVVDVQSALRITIEGQVGGLPTTIPLQLEGIRLIGPPDHALTKLKELCPPGCEVIIEVSGQRLETDAFGLAKAWILRDFTAPVDPASPPPPAGKGARHRTSLQVEMMRAGWAVLDDQQSGRPLPPRQIMEARKAIQEARQRRMGAYSLPGFEPPAERQLGQRPGDPQADVTTPPPVETPAPAANGAANGF
jgi:hypothetical protein